MPDRATSIRYEIPTGPEQFELSMKPEFALEHSREEVIGTPVRARVGDQVVNSGVVVDWVDEPDGGVILVVEYRAF
ncbi:hypothetical protein [Dactylosporangium sp. CS-033363]|uniref:hypothetical protein n=1 Tax=Dactylosporangium sp. CS-033363 TaxID=3239935 RepID=UPI003D94F7AD